MMNFAIKLTANRDDALDLLQDTMLKVLDNQEKFVDNVNFTGWVMTIMRNLFINNYHKIVRIQTRIDQDTDLYNLNIVNDNISGSPDKIYQIQEITKAITELNDEVKIPFSLFLNGYKYNEIAEKLNIPLGTIKVEFFRTQTITRKTERFSIYINNTFSTFLPKTIVWKQKVKNSTIRKTYNYGLTFRTTLLDNQKSSF